MAVKLGVTGSAQHFEAALGRPVDYVKLHVRYDSWSALEQSTAGTPVPGGKKAVWNFPVIVKGANLDAAADGAYDQQWKKALTNIAKKAPDSILVSHEFNGGWFPWSATNGKHDEYVAALTRLVKISESVSPNFKWGWAPALGYDPGFAGSSARSLKDYYPGHNVIDYIGVSIYDQEWRLEQGQYAERWNALKSKPWGLNDLAKLAAGKPMFFNEWGLSVDNHKVNFWGGGDSSHFVQESTKWLQANKGFLAIYFNSNWVDGDHILFGPGGSVPHFPKAAQTFKQLWGGKGGVPLTTPPSAVTSPTDGKVKGGADVITGSGTIYGTAGDDVIVGKVGAPNYVVTGAGKDVVVAGPGRGVKQIADHSAQDKVGLLGAKFADLNVVHKDALDSVTAYYKNQPVVTFVDTHINEINASDFINDYFV
jgi:hypothetical protein